MFEKLKKKDPSLEVDNVMLNLISPELKDKVKALHAGQAEARAKKRARTSAPDSDFVSPPVPDQPQPSPGQNTRGKKAAAAAAADPTAAPPPPDTAAASPTAAPADDQADQAEEYPPTTSSPNGMCVVCGGIADQTSVYCGHTCACLKCAIKIMGVKSMRRSSRRSAARGRGRGRGQPPQGNQVGKCPQCNGVIVGFIKVQKPVEFGGALAKTKAEIAEEEAERANAKAGAIDLDKAEEEDAGDEEGDPDDGSSSSSSSSDL